jgi:hypothetical protein
MSEIKWSSYARKSQTEKTPDWFWALGFVAISITIASVLLGNTLFGLLVLLAAFTLASSVNHTQEQDDYIINTRGVSISGTLYPYKSIEAFWIDDTREDRTLLIFDIQKPLNPHLIITLSDSVDIDTLQDYLLDYLPEEELYEPVAHRIAGILGF